MSGQGVKTISNLIIVFSINTPVVQRRLLSWKTSIHFMCWSFEALWPFVGWICWRPHQTWSARLYITIRSKYLRINELDTLIWGWLSAFNISCYWSLDHWTFTSVFRALHMFVILVILHFEDNHLHLKTLAILLRPLNFSDDFLEVVPYMW